uniref:Uncharacterized protein n=1 Tax=Romanomermis culicivorax TaxID=13658 RepID=A0A915KGT8_ROMCU
MYMVLGLLIQRLGWLDAEQQRKRLKAKEQTSSKIDSLADSILLRTHLASYEKSESMSDRLAVEQEHEMIETVVKSILEAKKSKRRESKTSDESSSSTLSENDDS